MVEKTARYSLGSATKSKKFKNYFITIKSRKNQPWLTKNGHKRPEKSPID